MPAPTLAPAAPRHRLTTDQRQREIVATVLALARERGPDAITTQAIADRMGLTQGAVFRHFPDKQAIWLAVFAWVRESLGAAVAVAVAKVDSPLAKIERAFLAHVAFIAENPGVPRIMFHEMQYPGDSPVRTEVRAMIIRIANGSRCSSRKRRPLVSFRVISMRPWHRCRSSGRCRGS